MEIVIEHVVFDFGDVLNYHLRTKEEKNALVQAAEMPPDIFFERYWRHRIAYDLGKLGAEQYWELILDDPSPGRVRTLRYIDVQVAVRLNFDMWLRLRQLKAAKLTLTLLSNMPYELARYHERSSVHDNFHHTFFSCDIGMMKPDPEVYEFVLQKTGKAPKHTLLIDNSAANVAAARKMGWQAVQFKSRKQLTTVLEKLYGLSLAQL